MFSFWKALNPNCILSDRSEYLASLWEHWRRTSSTFDGKACPAEQAFDLSCRSIHFKLHGPCISRHFLPCTISTFPRHASRIRWSRFQPTTHRHHNWFLWRNHWPFPGTLFCQNRSISRSTFSFPYWNVFLPSRVYGPTNYECLRSAIWSHKHDLGYHCHSGLPDGPHGDVLWFVALLRDNIRPLTSFCQHVFSCI